MSGDINIKQVKKLCVMLALKRTGGNRTQAARVLGVSLCTVRNWISEYGLPKITPSQKKKRVSHRGVEIGNAVKKEDR